jgi:hypothetical protein
MVFDSDATGSMGRARTGLGYDWHAWHIFAAMGPAALAYGLARWIDNTGEREEWERNMKERKAAAGDGGVMDGFAARGWRNGSSNDGSSSGTPMEVDELRAKLDEIRAALPVLEEELKRREGEKATEKRDDSADDEPTNVTKETAGDDASTSSPAPSPSPSRVAHGLATRRERQRLRRGHPDAGPSIGCRARARRGKNRRSPPRRPAPRVVVVAVRIVPRARPRDVQTCEGRVGAGGRPSEGAHQARRGPSEGIRRAWGRSSEGIRRARRRSSAAGVRRRRGEDGEGARCGAWCGVRRSRGSATRARGTLGPATRRLETSAGRHGRIRPPAPGRSLLAERRGEGRAREVTRRGEGEG